MFKVSNAVWQKYIREDMQGCILCEPCFKEIKKLIDEGGGKYVKSRRKTDS